MTESHPKSGDMNIGVSKSNQHKFESSDARLETKQDNNEINRKRIWCCRFAHQLTQNLQLTNAQKRPWAPLVRATTFFFLLLQVMRFP